MVGINDTAELHPIPPESGQTPLMKRLDKAQLKEKEDELRNWQQRLEGQAAAQAQERTELDQERDRQTQERKRLEDLGLAIDEKDKKVQKLIGDNHRLRELYEEKLSKTSKEGSSPSPFPPPGTPPPPEFPPKG
jgi:ribosomal protein L15